MGHFAPDERAIGLIAPYKAQLDADMNTIIGQAASEMNKAQPESTLGNWLADLLYEKTVDYHGKKVDLALVNYGGIRIPSIPQGGISRSRIYELMPFDNAMVLVYLDGATLLQLCDHMASKGGWPISQHLRYEITDGKAAQVELNGKAIQSDQIYVVSLSDYLANGGDSCDFLQDKKRENLEILVRDAILEYVEEKGKAGVVMSAELDGRVRQK
ncbi:MAG: 5'-nucleotidase [Bacteroidota bacterium]